MSDPGRTDLSSPDKTFSRASERLIVALDFPAMTEALALVDTLDDTVQWYKVGLELYLACGNVIVEELAGRGCSVFLDLKFHDIPNTVAGAVRSAARTGASLLTVHAAGGPAMIEAAVDAIANLSNRPRLLAVTVLTSLDQQQLAATGVGVSPAEQVALLGRMAVAAGVDGLVCSADEAGSLRALLGDGPLLLTPGIRPSGAKAGDQKRITTPSAALRNGASQLVVGRPITQAPDPRHAAEAILAEMETELES